MAIEDIKKNLEQRFSEPLPEFYERRIIFWNDEEKEFIDEVNELELSNAKVYKKMGFIMGLIIVIIFI